MEIASGFPSLRTASTVLPFVLVLVLALPFTPFASSASGLSGEEEFEGKKKKKDKKKSDEAKPDSKKPDSKESGDKKKPTIAEIEAAKKKEYVHTKLKDYLFPTAFKVLADGRVQMTISFREKKDEHMGIFSRKFGAGMRDPFRYTISQEEIVVGGDTGLRLSDKGQALINCWFLNDVEAEMEYLQFITHQQRLIGAIVFCTDKGRALGSNFGNQCVQFVKGRLTYKPKHKSQSVSFNQTARIKLAVRKGVFEAYRQGKKKHTMKYSEKKYQSGRIGFVWGGSTAIIVPTVTITGRLDYDMMAKVMQKYFGN